MQTATVNGTFSYTEDRNRIERPRRPTLAAANLLHHARQRTDTSRWWSMRWPSGAVPLVGRSLNLDTGKTYKLMRQLREHSTTYLTKLWQLTVDRTGERDNTEARQRLRADWAETKRRLGTHGRNAKRQLIPGWVVVTKLFYKLKHQLAAWKRVRAKAVLRGGVAGSAPSRHYCLPRRGRAPPHRPARRLMSHHRAPPPTAEPKPRSPLRVHSVRLIDLDCPAPVDEHYLFRPPPPPSLPLFP